MTSTVLPLDRESMRLIAEIGFIGTQTGQLGASRAIFDSLRVLRPDSSLPLIGLALVLIAANKPAVAAQFLRDSALTQFPGDPELTAFLGLALQCAGKNSEAQEALSKVVEQPGATATPYARMADKLMAMNTGAGSPVNLFPRWSEYERITGQG